MVKSLSSRAAHWLLLAIILVYAALAVLFAAYTPDWQAPDEPAHYNYIRALAEQHRFPILKPGDYPAQYLEEIKAAHFPPEMSIEPIRYEFHQPPLYYLLAMPVYQVFRGALLPLRLVSVLIGAVLLLVIYWTVRAAAPGQPGLALSATALAALWPMHLAQSAAVGNDLLAELILATIMLLAIRYLQVGASGPSVRRDRQRLLVLLGIATGLAFVCKSGIYVALPLVLLAITARLLWLEERPFTAMAWLKSAGLYLLPAILLALPWWLRNVALYGGADLLGLSRHNQVVVGQLRTADYIAAHGVAGWLGDLGLTTFRSLWGQFGWMGVLIDRRLYQALALFSAVALIGLVAWVVRLWRQHARRASLRPKGVPIAKHPDRREWTGGSGRAAPPMGGEAISALVHAGDCFGPNDGPRNDGSSLALPATTDMETDSHPPRWQLIAAGLLAVWALTAVASYLWYNAQFVQFQGRYLFTALLPISLGVAIGWREALRRDRAWLLAALAAAGAVVLAAASLLCGDLATWPVLMLLVAAAAFAVRRFLPWRWDPLVELLPPLLLIPLDLACLFLFVVPQLSP